MRVATGRTRHRHQHPALRRVRNVKEPDNEAALRRSDRRKPQAGTQGPIDSANREPPGCVDGAKTFSSVAEVKR